MTILITGATGLVGTDLSESLINQGHKIHYLTTSNKKIESKLNFKGFYWNPKTAEIDVNCLENVDAIIHLAGANIANRWTNSYKKEILDSRILSTNLLFETLKNNKNQVKNFISASGTAIYPDSETAIYKEDFNGKADGFLSNVVIEWEASADKISALNINVCKLRTGIVYAKNGGALQEIVKPIKLGIGSSFGTGNQMQSWIHIDDLVKIYEFCLQKNISGVVNAVAPNPVSDKMLTKTIASILKKPLFMPNIPRFVMKLILGDMHELLFTDKNISSQKIVNQGFVFQYPDIENALKDILL
jgi:uncharacterized protein (TIGR01777 family)